MRQFLIQQNTKFHVETLGLGLGLAHWETQHNLKKNF